MTEPKRGSSNTSPKPHVEEVRRGATVIIGVVREDASELLREKPQASYADALDFTKLRKEAFEI